MCSRRRVARRVTRTRCRPEGRASRARVLKGDVAVINAMQRRMLTASTPDKIFDHLWRFLHCSQRRVGTHYLPGSIEIFEAIDQAYSVGVMIRFVPVPRCPARTVCRPLLSALFVPAAHFGG